MNNDDVSITLTSAYDEIQYVIKHCAPFFFNQSINDIELIDSLSNKFYNYGKVLVAKINDELLGYCAYYANDRNNHVAYLSMIILVSKAQGKGVGGKLLDEMIKDCRKEGMQLIRLEVNDANLKAQRFYEKNGFVREGKKSSSSYYYSKRIVDDMSATVYK